MASKKNQKIDKNTRPAETRFIDDDETTISFIDEGGFSAVYTGGCTHIGTREYQEDSYFVTEASSSQESAFIKAYGIVCDGMGGLENGSKASQLATELTKDVFERIQSDDRIEALLIREIDRIDQCVMKECGGGDGLTAGTTLVAAMVLGKHLHWIGVGDSRIYVMRGDEIVQVTQDHTYMMKLQKSVEDGLISQEVADTHPQRGALISYVGSGSIQYVNTNKAGLSLIHGDIVLLCSDGLTKSLDDKRIAAIIRTWYGDMKKTAQQLILQAFDTGSGAKDNTTVVLMQYLE